MTVNTRFYQPNTGTPAVSPAFLASIEDTASMDRITLVLTKIGSAMTTKTVSVTGSGVGDDVGFRQYVSDPLAADIVFTSGDVVKGQSRTKENAAGNDQHLVRAIRIFSQDGTTLRATLRTLTNAGNTECDPTTLTNRTWSATLGASYTTVSGDRIVIDEGKNRGSSAGNGQISYGDDSGSDLAEDNTTTTANNPWIEFQLTSNTPITLASASAAVPVFTNHYTMMMR